VSELQGDRSGCELRPGRSFARSPGEAGLGRCPESVALVGNRHESQPDSGWDSGQPRLPVSVIEAEDAH